MKNLTQHQIIEGCKQKDAYYQKALVMRYSKVLMAVSLRYSRDAAMAKDVLQEALIKILNNVHKYREEGKFEAWMKRIVINHALKTLDKKYFKHTIIELKDIQHSSVIEPEAYNTMAAADLMALINTLPNGYREVFNLYAIEGFSHKEIGKMLGIAESTSRSQLARARVLLKQKLQIEDKIRMSV